MTLAGGTPARPVAAQRFLPASSVYELTSVATFAGLGPASRLGGVGWGLMAAQVGSPRFSRIKIIVVRRIQVQWIW